MNTDQLEGILRTLGASLAGYLAGKGYFFDANTWNVIFGSIGTVALAIWSAKVHTDAGKVTAATTVPGVSVEVAPVAPESVKALAADPAVPKVTMK